MELFYTVVLLALTVNTFGTQVLRRRAIISSFENHQREHSAIESVLVSSIVECSQRCVLNHEWCVGANFNTLRNGEKYTCEILHSDGITGELLETEGWVYMQAREVVENQEESQQNGRDKNDSCKSIKERYSNVSDGIFWLNVDSEKFQVYCDMQNGGFTLIARFSNADAKNWMNKTGDFWYKRDTYGMNTSTTDNADMLSIAFSTVKGNDLKISRNDDHQHNALMLATGCMKGVSMRTKMTSYGDFSNGTLWTTKDECHDSCKAIFAGKYNDTDGFLYAKANCATSSDIQYGGHIGFWCYFEKGDGAVLMIGAGGQNCGRADHGIGITEENTARLGVSIEGAYDFGNDAHNIQSDNDYSLNLWIR